LNALPDDLTEGQKQKAKRLRKVIKQKDTEAIVEALSDLKSSLFTDQIAYAFKGAH